MHQFAVRYPDLTIFPREFDEKLAMHGLHLKTKKQVQIGDEVAVQFRFPQREEPLVAIGVVAWMGAQPEADGKRSIVIRDLAFDEASQRVLDLVRSTPPVEETHLPSSIVDSAPAAAAAPVTAPPPDPVPASIPARSPASENTDTVPVAVSQDAALTSAPKKSRKGWIALLVLLVVLGGLAVWLLYLGGLQWVEMTFLPPPAPLTIPMQEAVAAGPEPPMKAPKAPPPPVHVVARAVATSFDYYQRNPGNQFVVTFNRPAGRVAVSKSENPAMDTFYVQHARSDLDKSQYFLPFTLVRTVTFEQQGDVLAIHFLAQNPNYLPDPVWTLDGRELNIRFVPSQ